MSIANGHIGQLALRRRRAGETAVAAAGEAAAQEAHLAACADCRARLRAVDDQQRRFEQQISFDRFAAGVERAARGQAAAERRRQQRRAVNRGWLYPVAALAAGIAIMVTFVPRPGSGPGREPNRIKGGAGITIRVAGADGQRTARVEGTEPLARGERLRLGYYPDTHRYVLSLSIDEHGEVSPLYPERGASLQVPEGTPTTRYLPDSLELTGSGTERIIVVLSDRPIDVEAAGRAARAAFERGGGDLSRMPALGLPGEEFSRTFSKP
jgi:hypothetical protein